MAALNDAVATVTDEQRELPATLASLAEMIEGNRSTVMMLERERMIANIHDIARRVDRARLRLRRMRRIMLSYLEVVAA